MGNFFQNFGLMTEGSNAAQHDRNALVAQSQGLEAGKQNLYLGVQRSKLNDINLQTSQVGLDTLKRGQADDAAMRGVAQTGATAGQPTTQTLDDMAAEAEKQGNMEQALQLRTTRKALQASGIVDAASEWYTSKTAGPRPDLASHIPDADPTSITADDKGMVSFKNKRTGAPVTFNAEAVLTLSGALKEPKITTIPAGGMGVIQSPGQPPRTIEAPKTYAPATAASELKVIKVKVGDNERDYLWNAKTHDWEGEKPPAGTPTPEGGPGSIRKDLPVYKEIADAAKSINGLYVVDSASDPLNPLKKLTPKGETAVNYASHLWQNNQSLPPQVALSVIANANKDTLAKDSEGGIYVKYQGKWLTVVPGSGPPGESKPAAPAQPAAKPAAATPAETAAPVEPPPSKKTRGLDTREADIAKFNEGLSGAGRRPAAEKSLAAKQSEVAKEFPTRIQRFSKEDKAWLDDHLGQMSNAQKKQYRDKLENKQYKEFVGA